MPQRIEMTQRIVTNSVDAADAATRRAISAATTLNELNVISICTT